MVAKPNVAKKIDGRTNNGGARPGGGRAPGSKTSIVTTLTRRMATEMVEAGESPLDLMHENMMFWWRASNSFGEKLTKMLIAAEKKESEPSLAQRIEATDLLKNFLNARDKAQQCAVDAAPYFHPRLQSIAIKAQISHEVQKILGDMTPNQAAEAYAATIK